MNCSCKPDFNKICKILWSITFIFFILLFLLTLFCCINNQQEKSILTAIAVDGDNTEVGVTSIKFSMNNIVVGSAISHTIGSDEIEINENGIYQISYQLYGQRKTIGTFNFAAVLLVNNNAVNNTFNESPILKDNVANRMTLTSTVILKLNSGDILKLQGVSIEDIYYTTARIDIEKIN